MKEMKQTNDWQFHQFAKFQIVEFLEGLKQLSPRVLLFKLITYLGAPDVIVPPRVKLLIFWYAENL